jgi:hypothetical protein
MFIMVLAAGLGLAASVFMLIVCVYLVVSVIEYAVEENMSTWKTCVAVAQFVALSLISFVLIAGIGWLLIQPLLSVLNICG